MRYFLLAVVMLAACQSEWDREEWKWRKEEARAERIRAQNAKYHSDCTYLPVSDSAFTPHEQEWVKSLVRQDGVGKVVKTWKEDVQYRNRNGKRETTWYYECHQWQVDSPPFVVNVWGHRVGWSNARYDLQVNIDGVENVYEVGRWWKELRRLLNRMTVRMEITRGLKTAMQNREDSVCWATMESTRLFKLDSTMKVLEKVK